MESLHYRIISVDGGSNTTQSKERTKYMNNNNGQKLAGKVAVVNGGSRGIGATITKRLAADGASVAFTYAKGADAAASVVKEIERCGGKAIAIQADAADPNAVKASVEKAAATLRTGYTGEQCRHGHSETVRGDHPGGDGSRDRHQHPRRIRRDAGGA